MTLYTQCPICHDPLYATDHDKGCPKAYLKGVDLKLCEHCGFAEHLHKRMTAEDWLGGYQMCPTAFWEGQRA